VLQGVWIHDRRYFTAKYYLLAANAARGAGAVGDVSHAMSSIRHVYVPAVEGAGTATSEK